MILTLNLNVQRTRVEYDAFNSISYGIIMILSQMSDLYVSNTCDLTFLIQKCESMVHSLWKHKLNMLNLLSTVASTVVAMANTEMMLVINMECINDL